MSWWNSGRDGGRVRMSARTHSRIAEEIVKPLLRLFTRYDGLQRGRSGGERFKRNERSSARPLRRCAAAERGQLVLVSSLVRVHNELVTRRVRPRPFLSSHLRPDHRCPPCRPLAGNRQTSELFRGARCSSPRPLAAISPTTARARARTAVSRGYCDSVEAWWQPVRGDRAGAETNAAARGEQEHRPADTAGARCNDHERRRLAKSRSGRLNEGGWNRGGGPWRRRAQHQQLAASSLREEELLETDHSSSISSPGCTHLQAQHDHSQGRPAHDLREPVQGCVVVPEPLPWEPHGQKELTLERPVSLKQTAFSSPRRTLRSSTRSLTSRTSLSSRRASRSPRVAS